MNLFTLDMARYIKEIARSRLNGRSSALVPLLMGIGNTAEGVSILAGSGHTNEMYMVGRALVERTVTMCYLLVCDDDEYERYDKYTRQKAYRVLDQQISVGAHTARVYYTGKDEIDVSSIPGLKEALDEYTSRRGRAVTRWSKVSLSDQVDVIGQRSKLNTGVLLMCLLSIYDRGSEALHATLYGCAFHLGAFNPHKPECEEYVLGDTSMVLFTCGAMLRELLRLLCEVNGLTELRAEISARSRHHIDILEKALRHGRTKPDGV